MVTKTWIPDAGEIVWIRLDPQAGREQAGQRRAVVVTPASYNRRSELLLCVPLTIKAKGYPFEVPVQGAPASVALVDHIRSVDWRARGTKKNGWARDTELEEIKAKLRALIG